MSRTLATTNMYSSYYPKSSEFSSLFFSIMQNSLYILSSLLPSFHLFFHLSLWFRDPGMAPDTEGEFNKEFNTVRRWQSSSGADAGIPGSSHEGRAGGVGIQ